MDYIMDNNEYTQQLQSFYKETFKELVGQSSTRSSSTLMQDIKSMTDAAFKEYSSVFNERFADVYLENINEKSQSLTEKLNNFPKIYWQTPQGEETLKIACAEAASAYSLFKEAEAEGVLTESRLHSKVAFISNLARDVSRYDTNAAQDMIRFFHNDFTSAFSQPYSPKVESADMYKKILVETCEAYQTVLESGKLPKSEEAVFFGFLHASSLEKVKATEFNVGGPKKLVF